MNRELRCFDVKSIEGLPKDFFVGLLYSEDVTRAPTILFCMCRNHSVRKGFEKLGTRQKISP